MMGPGGPRPAAPAGAARPLPAARPHPTPTATLPQPARRPSPALPGRAVSATVTRTLRSGSSGPEHQRARPRRSAGNRAAATAAAAAAAGGPAE